MASWRIGSSLPLPLISKRSVRALDLLGVACCVLSLMPVSVLQPSTRSAWQCLLVATVVGGVGALEVWREDAASGRARRVFGRTCAAALPSLSAAVLLAASSGPCAPLAAVWNAGWVLLPTVPLAAGLGVFAGSCSRSVPPMVARLATRVVALWFHDLGWSNLSVSFLTFDHLGLWSVEDAADASRLYIPPAAVASRVGSIAWGAVFVVVAPQATS